MRIKKRLIKQKNNFAHIDRNIKKIKINEKYANPNDFIGKKFNIGVLIVATNKYIEFIPNLLEGLKKYFLINHNITFHIFTDQPDHDLYKSDSINTYFVAHKKWPYNTLLRYHMFIGQKDNLLKEDYLYYIDADMKVVDYVNEKIIGERVATIHPGFLGDRGTPEDNPRSTAYVNTSEHMIYFAGAFNGGSSEEFIKMSEIISRNIDIDFENNIIAKWHDESHTNRYFIDNKPTIILDPGYCYATYRGRIPYKKKISTLNKNYNYYRD